VAASTKYSSTTTCDVGVLTVCGTAARACASLCVKSGTTTHNKNAMISDTAKIVPTPPIVIIVFATRSATRTLRRVRRRGPRPVSEG